MFDVSSGSFGAGGGVSHPDVGRMASLSPLLSLCSQVLPLPRWHAGEQRVLCTMYL